MVFQIAQGCGIAPTPGEEVLIDAQYGRTAGAMPFSKLSLQPTSKVALYGGRSDSLSPAQPGRSVPAQGLAQCWDLMLRPRRDVHVAYLDPSCKGLAWRGKPW